MFLPHCFVRFAVIPHGCVVNSFRARACGGFDLDPALWMARTKA
jgi:hypothetical protein